MKHARHHWGEAVGEAPWASLLPPAPGDLRIVQALVNTAHLESGSDELETPRALADWLGRWGLLRGAQNEIGQPELERAIALREALRALIRANLGTAVEEAALAVLNREADATLRVRFSGRGHELAAVGGGFESAVGRLLGIVAQAQSQDTWPRLKICPGEGCGWTFYDASRIRNRRWCSMQRCGNRVKARTYRQRHETHLRLPARHRRKPPRSEGGFG